MILNLAIGCAVATHCRFELVTVCYNPLQNLNVDFFFFGEMVQTWTL